MSRKINRIKMELTPKEYMQLSKQNKARYNENYISAFLDLNKEQGLTLTECSKVIKHLSKPTILKYMERLIAKRQIYKVERDKLVIYYPNNRPLHPLYNKTIILENGKKYIIQVLDGPDGLAAFVQEATKDLFGMEETVGGIMIPLCHIEKIQSVLLDISSKRMKLVDDLKRQTNMQVEQKYGTEVIQ